MPAKFPTRVAMDAFLSIRFFAGEGKFMLADPIPVLFPPAAPGAARLVVRSAAGEVASADAEIVPMVGYPAFGQLQGAYGAPVFLGPIGAGDYAFGVQLDGQEITAYGFSMSQLQSDDPFNPSTEMVRTGPWSAAAFLINPLERPGEATHIGVWMNAAEFPGYVPRTQVPISWHLLAGDTQVASVEGRITDPSWEFFRFELAHRSEKITSGPFTWSSLVSTPGAHTLECRSGGNVVRRYRFSVDGGKVGRVASNELGYPGTDALPPQSIMTISGTTQRVEQYWLAL